MTSPNPSSSRQDPKPGERARDRNYVSSLDWPEGDDDDEWDDVPPQRDDSARALYNVRKTLEQPSLGPPKRIDGTPRAIPTLMVDPDKEYSPFDPPDSEAIADTMGWLNADSRANEKFLDSKPFPLDDLRMALRGIIKGTLRVCDSELKREIARARGQDYCIRTKTSNFFKDRPVPWERMMISDIDSWDESTVKEYLSYAEDEIVWMKQELRHLQLHMEIAKEQKKAGTRNSFGYKPTERPKMKGPIQRTPGGGLEVRQIH